MGVMLFDLKSDDHRLKCNWWNWRPTLELLRTCGIVRDEERLMLLGLNCCGAELSSEEAHAFARYLDEGVLTRLHPGDRVLLDMSVTDVPDDGTFYKKPDELHKNYSACYEWLSKFSSFCKECGGFAVV